MVDEGPSVGGTALVGSPEAEALDVLETATALNALDALNVLGLLDALESVGTFGAPTLVSGVPGEDATGSVVTGEVLSPQPTSPSRPNMLSAQIEPSSRRRPITRGRVISGPDGCGRIGCGLAIANGSPYPDNGANDSKDLLPIITASPNFPRELRTGRRSAGGHASESPGCAAKRRRRENFPKTSINFEETLKAG
jgi:hypothetical protein